MRGRLALVMLMLAVTIALAAGCSGGSAEGTGTGAGGGTSPKATANTGNTGNTGSSGGSGGPIRPTWIGSDMLSIEGNTLHIPATEVVGGRMLHFKLSTGQYGEQNFMAYDLGGDKYVRANVCPPCRSVGFSLDGNILVCDSCGTRFEAATGAGISGACKDFPKAQVEHAVSSGDITVGVSDLIAAYEDTEKPGWP